MKKYVFLVIILLPCFAYATTPAFYQVGDLACAVARTLSGTIAKAIATIGIVFLGARAFVGKLDWATVLIVALGVFIIFGFFPIIKTVVDFTGNAAAITHVQNLCN